MQRSIAVFEEYHSLLTGAIEDIHQRFGKKPILFIDIHAQRAKDDPRVEPMTSKDFETCIIVGCQDGRTVRSREALYAKGGILFLLRTELAASDASYTIYPSHNGVRDHPQYNGGTYSLSNIFSNFRINHSFFNPGQVVARYGSTNLQIDALQWEFGSKLRLSTKTRSKTVAAVARAIAASEYL